MINDGMLTKRQKDRGYLKILYQSFGAMVAIMSQNLVELLALAFTSHYNPSRHVFGGVGLGLLYLNMSCLSIGYGFAGGLDTLVSQSYGNSDDYLIVPKSKYMCGVHLNRARILSTILFIPQTLLIFYWVPILLFLGQDIDIIEHTKTYLLIVIPGAWCMVQYENTKWYLHAMKEFNLPMYVQCFTCFLHFLILHFYGQSKGLLEIEDIATIVLINYILNFSIITGIITVFKDRYVPKNSWHFFDKNSFKNLHSYWAYGIPTALMRWLDWWSLEFISIMAGWLTTTEFLASVSMINLQSLLFMLPNGLASSTCNLVGNALGANCPEEARKYAKAGVVTAFGFSTVVWVVLFIFKSQVAHIYSTDHSVQACLESTIPIICLFVLFDHVQWIECGIIRSMGYQNFGTIWVLVWFWFIGLPCSYILGFLLGFQIHGIYFGIVIAVIVLASVFTWNIIKTDWDELAESVSKRLIEEENEVEMSVSEITVK